MMENERDFASLCESIKEKRKRRAARRRRALAKLTALLMVLFVLLSGLVYALYCLITWGNSIYNDYQAVYLGYKERQQQRLGNIDPNFVGYTNVLVMGLDDGADESGNNIRRADTIMVISLDNETGQVRFINIPRDAWVAMPVTGDKLRLKDAYATGGAPLMVRQVSSLLGVSIHQYVTVDMQSFVDLVDIIGGVDLYVERPMDYEDPEANLAIHLKQGYQHLDGNEAQQYLRYRSDDHGDNFRLQRQQKFIKAFYQKVVQLDTLTKLPAIATIFQERLETSAEIFDSMHLANVLRHLATDEPVSLTLPGANANNDETIWLPDETAIQAKMQELFPVANNNE